MKRTVVVISLIFLCSSCFVHKGKRIDGKCRPKNPSFKLKDVDFNKTNKLVFNKVYVADNVTKSTGYGFYSDGRLVFLHSKDGYKMIPAEIKNKNWSTAPAIGYWRMYDAIIETEYFSCSNSGDYIEKKGFVKGDTIFFERNCGSKPFKREKCYDKYILSSMSFD